jgi:hypothetical protein
MVWPDAIDNFTPSIFGEFQVITSLKIHPKLGVVPKKRESRSAVSAVIARFPRTMSFTRVAGTFSSMASRLAVRPSGFRKSSRSVSPGWIGGIVFFFAICYASVVVRNLNAMRA